MTKNARRMTKYVEDNMIPARRRSNYAVEGRKYAARRSIS
jgi:hypothetical protein